MPISTPQAVLEAYIEGSKALDVSKLSGCFHPRAIMHGFLMGNPVFGTPELYFSDVDRMSKSGEKNIGYDAEIADLTIQDAVASATIVMRNFAGLNFKDFMHLIKDDGRWSIISKTFTTI